MWRKFIIPEKIPCTTVNAYVLSEKQVCIFVYALLYSSFALRYSSDLLIIQSVPWLGIYFLNALNLYLILLEIRFKT